MDRGGQVSSTFVGFPAVRATLRWLRRTAVSVVPVAIGVVVAVFLLLRIVPGDPATMILGERATPESIAALRQQLGLNEPLWKQFVDFVGGIVLHGDTGTSLVYGVSTRELIFARAPISLTLVAMAVIFSVLIAVPLAMLAATRQDRFADHVVRVVPMVGLGMPAFWLGLVLILIFSVGLRWFPVAESAQDRGSRGGVSSSPRSRSPSARALARAFAACPAARGSRFRLRRDAHRRARAASSGAVPARAAQRGDPHPHAAERQRRLPHRRHRRDREGLRDQRTRNALVLGDQQPRLPGRPGCRALLRPSWSSSSRSSWTGSSNSSTRGSGRHEHVHDSPRPIRSGS